MESKLRLGWLVNRDNHPLSWLGADVPKLDAELDDRLVFAIPPEAMEHHSVLFAQSGSGKSFFVGRLIEEIILNTSPRILIIDPNSDYLHIDEVAPDAFNYSGYNPFKGTGTLPTETDYERFRKLWSNLAVVRLHEKIQIPINFLDPDVFLSRTAADSPMKVRCAFTYLRLIDEYLSTNWQSCRRKLDVDNSKYTIDGLIKAIEAYQEMRGDTRPKFNAWLGEPHLPDKFDAEQLRGVNANTKRINSDVAFLNSLLDSEILDGLFLRVKDWERFLQVSQRSRSEVFRQSGLYVLDKPRLPPGLEYTVMKFFLDTVWEMHEENYKQGRLDRPTFIFIDEAHNLIPKDTGGQLHVEILRDLLRKVAAEGRKYGVFLFIISQRPDKLDPLVVSECQNKIIMRVGSMRALDEAAATLGLTGGQVEELSEAVNFKTGRAFIIGPMAEASTVTASTRAGAVKLYAAARRTREGGEKLSPDWRSNGLLHIPEY